MKRVLFAALTAMMMVACGAPTEKITITEQGVGPIVLGATAEDFPATFEGLYDEIVVEHIDAYFDDWMYEDVPASDNYTFKREGNQSLQSCTYVRHIFRYKSGCKSTLNFSVLRYFGLCFVRGCLREACYFGKNW